MSSPDGSRSESTPAAPPAPRSYSDRLASRHRTGLLFEWICWVSTWFGLVVLAIFLIGLFIQGWEWLDWSFLSSYEEPNTPEEAGFLAAIWGTIWLMILTALFSIPLGVGAAIYLEEYSSDTWLRRLIQVNLANLAGVPSIVYGMLGLSVFARFFGVLDEPIYFHLDGVENFELALPFGPVVITGALTLSLLVLPVVIVASQEALRAVPPSIRHASLALGATRWQTIRNQVLPASIPGIMTGVILSLSRAIGETAPIVVVGAARFIQFSPGHIESVADPFKKPFSLLQAPFDAYTCMPMQIYAWTDHSKEGYKMAAAAGIIVLLAVLLVMNGIAVFIRNKYSVKNW